MSVKLNPPEFSHGKNYERFKQELLAWREVTELAKEKQGIVIALSLPESDCGIREKIFDNIDLSELKKENGFEILVNFLDTQLGKDDLADSLEKFEEFEDLERERGQSINDYISKFDQRYHKIVKKGMKLPEEILAFKLLKRAHITKEEKMLVMTGMDYSNKGNLYEQAKISLKKFLGQQAGGGGNSYTLPQQAIKVEPTFATSETFFTQYAGRPRGRSWNRRFMRGRGRTSGMRGRQVPDRNMNPIGSNGKPLTCLSCGSFRHLIAQCPDSWENISKVNYAMHVGGNAENEESIEQVVLFTGNIKDGLAQLGRDARYSAVLDSACSSTVCGSAWLESYLETLDSEQLDEVLMEDGVKVFKFGGGETLKSLGNYVIPAHVAGKDIKITTDVVESDIPLLLSLKAMKHAKIKLDLENDAAEILGVKVNLNYTTSGHYCIPIDKHEKVSVEEVNAVFLPQLDKNERFKALAKLHRQFAHPPEKKLVALLQDAGCWNNDFQETVTKIYDSCQLCKVYTKTPARPVVALPMAKNFNETVAMDLKKWRNGWILHLVDMWSRLTISSFIHRKTPKEVIDKIMTHWVGAGYGVMQGILTDNGGEFSAEEMREVASILNIKVHTTAAESPFQNGLCERIHSVTDMMLAKMEEQCPQTPLNVLLCWANMARNALQMWHGFSSYQLVFGRNPNLPNIMNVQLPALDGVTRSEVLAKHLNALHAARKSFMESEACERIRRALRSKVRASAVKYSPGESVYYKRENSDKWLGPGKVMFQDGKVIFVRHGGVFIRASPNRLIKTGLEFVEKDQCDTEQKTSTSRGDEFQTDRFAMPYEVFGKQNSCSESSTTSEQENTESQQKGPDKMSEKIELFKGERIQYRETEGDDFVSATIVSRGGKVSGQYKNWFNIKIDGFEDVKSVNLEQVDNWQRIDIQEVNMVSVPKSRHEDKDCVQAKQEELEKLKEFNTYTEVEDRGQNCISTRWVICQKGAKVKARLVARGFEEDFEMRRDSPTIGKSALRVFLTLAAAQKWKIGTTDIKSAFLQGNALDRDVFIVPPNEANVSENIIWKLNHCLYGLNDAARQFYHSVRDVLVNLKCVQSHLDPALFFMHQGSTLIGLIACHVDDFLHCGKSDFDTVIESLVYHFKAGKRETGQFKYVGFQIRQTDDEIILDQAEYMEDLEVKHISPQRRSQKTDSLSSKEHTILRGLVGKLNWMVQGSRPDLAFEMIELSMKFKKGLVEDLLRAIRVIGKLKQNDAKICFPNIGDVSSWKLIVYSDAGHANLCDGVSSVGAHLILLLGDKSRCCPLAWHAGKIKRVVRSTIAAEALSLQEGLEEAVYLRELLQELMGERVQVPICAYIDNRSVVDAVHSTKLVDDKRLRLDIAAIQQSLTTKEINSVRWVPGQEQLANAMTKRGASSNTLLTVVQSGILQLI